MSHLSERSSPLRLGAFAFLIVATSAGTSSAQRPGGIGSPGGLGASPSFAGGSAGGLSASPASRNVVTNGGIAGLYGGGTGPFMNNGGFNNNYGTSYGYGYGYGFPGYGYGYNYGYPAYGYGYYPAFGVATGYGGLGYGGFGYGYPAYGSYNATAADTVAAVNGSYNAYRYNVASAEAVAAYQQAELTHQKAIGQLIENRQKLGNGRRNEPAADRGSNADRKDSESPTEPLPIDEVLAPDGSILWPLTTPKGADLNKLRSAAETAIARAVEPHRAGKSAQVRDLVAAREALADFAQPAHQVIKTDDSERQAQAFEHFVMSLDYHLRTMALRQSHKAPAGRGQPTGTVIPKPDNAPKTAGEVLKEQQRSQPDRGGTTPPKDQ